MGIQRGDCVRMLTSRRALVISFFILIVSTGITLFLIYKNINHPLSTMFIYAYVLFVFLFFIYFIILTMIGLRKLTWSAIRGRIYKFIVAFIFLSVFSIVFNSIFQIGNQLLWRAFDCFRSSTGDNIF